MKWAVGLNYHIYDGVHNLTNKERKEIFIPVANQGVIYDYENNLQRQLQGHVCFVLYSAIKYQPLLTTKIEILLSLLTLVKIPCLLSGMSILVLLAKLFLIHILMASLLSISIIKEPWSQPLVKLQLLLNNGLPFGSGKKRNLATLLLKWTKKLTVCRSLSNSIITKISLLRLERQESFSGYGRTVKEASNSTLLKFQLKRLLLKQSSSQILVKQCLVQRKDS